ncbi:UDP-glycosyltransferase 74G1-like [Senna tora]|uniref:Glycosyltransferase n=1 Tax=Senna tora TaxID=362788 RepID=A0A835CKU0_9FABA|nr:UDP-glycosyltransferase 74G1-like [Senna tora]
MESKTIARRPHCLVLAFPGQGHINPMLEFSKLLQHKGIKVTFVTTLSFCKNLQTFPNSIPLETISDGFDNGGYEEAGSRKVYYDSIREAGKHTLIELIHNHNYSNKGNNDNNIIDCLVYNSFMGWALDVAKRFGLVGVCFLTQNVGVNSIYYHVNKGMLKVPLLENEEIWLPGLPSLAPCEMPSFLYEYGDEPAAFDLVVGQFSNIEKADWILCNTFYELQKEVADYMTKIWPKLRTIGPTIPYKLLMNTNNDAREGLKEDEQEDYGFAHFKSEECTEWLDDQPKGSVVFVSFGSLATLNEEQMEEIVWGLRDSDSPYYLWVVRDSEESKLPKEFKRKSKKGMVVSWCHQIKVLSHEAIGCFVTHCGWNSTIEALSLGVPMVAFPQLSDQTTNAKFIEDVWKNGVRAPIDEKGIVRGEALRKSIWEILKGEKGSEIRSNAIKWRNLAIMAVQKGGSSCNNFEEFVDDLLRL